MNLKISEVEIKTINEEDSPEFLGYANFIVNDSFKLCHVCIFSCPNHPTGIRLGFPQKDISGLRLNTIFPINSRTYEACVDAISAAYKDMADQKMQKD